MKIKSVRLQNIKSYTDEIITFNDGVNFISGVNGAGKTTLIEAIGYALFDRRPGILKEFIRYGSGTGTITVEFEANDERMYRVVRKCGNVNSWVVYDIESDSELDLHTAADVKPWLKEIMGIDREQDLSQIFEDIIGVGQGTFTAPFLDTPAGRRDKFNKMLKVEVYKDAHFKTKSTVRFIEDKVQEARVEVARRQGSILEYDNVQQKKGSMKPVIDQLTKELVFKKKEKVKRAKILDELKKLSVEIQLLKNKISINEVTLKNLKEKEGNLKENLINSERSRKILLECESGFVAYNNAKKELDVLEKHRVERDRLNKMLINLNQSIGELSVKIESEKQNVNIELTDISKKTKEYTSSFKKQQSDIEDCRNKYDQIKILDRKVREIETSLDKLEDIKKNYVLINTKYESVISRWAELLAKETETNEKLSKEKELICEMQKLKSLEEKRDLLLQRTAAVESEIKALEDNREKTANGKCPFLDAPCKNVGGDGDLNKFFSMEIEKKIRIKTQYSDELTKLKRLIAEDEQRRIELSELEGAKNLLKTIEKEKNRYINSFSAYRDNLKNNFCIKPIEDLYNTFANCLEDKTIFSKQNELDVVLKKLNEAARSFSNSGNNFAMLSLGLNGTDLFTFRNLITDFSVVLERMEEVLTQFKAAYRVVSAIIAKVSSLRNAEYVKAKEAMENTKNNLSELQKRQKKVDERNVRISKMTEELTKLNGEKEKVEAKLSIYDNLDQCIVKEKEIMQNNQKQYDEYIKHLTEAQKVEKIKSEIESILQLIHDTEEEHVRFSELLQRISKDFSEEKLSEAEKFYNIVSEEVATKQNSLNERLRELEELSAKLSEMDKIKAEIEKINKEIMRLSEINEMLAFVRSILNKAGERVSAVYRNYLAIEANRIYHEISNDNVTLDWKEDYEVVLIDNFNGRERERCFRQLSGGEQMTAALAMRLGFLQQLTNVGLGFFDEPTINLDSARRNNLARVLPRITGNFDQLFVISHDDSFDSMTENVVQLIKDFGDGTKIM